MSDSMQSKINTALISLTLAVGGAGLKFWRDVSISLAKMEQVQTVSAADVVDLRTRLTALETDCRQRFSALEVEILRLKIEANRKL